MLHYIEKLYINVAFYKKDPSTLQQQQQENEKSSSSTKSTNESMMTFFTWLSRKYHSDLLKDPNEIPMVHCAIIMKDPNSGREYVYDYLTMGARKLEGRDWRTSGGWDCFISIPVTREQYTNCFHFLEKEVKWCDENMNTKYDIWNIQIPLRDRPLSLPLGPLRLAPYVGECIPGGEKSYTCGSYICVALQKAKIPEMMKFVSWKTTPHMIMCALEKKYPRAGPESVDGLRFVK
jgi:hypothetical protein